jgi:hypothetical protein
MGRSFAAPVAAVTPVAADPIGQARTDDLNGKGKIKKISDSRLTGDRSMITCILVSYLFLAFFNSRRFDHADSFADPSRRDRDDEPARGRRGRGGIHR